MPFEKPLILLVDDEPDIVRMLKMHLERAAVNRT